VKGPCSSKPIHIRPISCAEACRPDPSFPSRLDPSDHTHLRQAPSPFPLILPGRHCRGRRASQQTTVPTRYPACPRRQRSDDHHRSRPSSASSRAACGLTLPVSSPLAPAEAERRPGCCSRWEGRARGPPSSRCRPRSSCPPASAPRSPTRSG
jgi:hypothetical protein